MDHKYRCLHTGTRHKRVDPQERTHCGKATSSPPPTWSGTVRTTDHTKTQPLMRDREGLLHMRFDMSRTARRPPIGNTRRFNRIDICDGSTIETTQTMTLPCKILRGAIEKIAHFQSTTSLTDHGELSFLRLNRCQHTLRFWHSLQHASLYKHKHCHVRRLSQVIDNSGRGHVNAEIPSLIERDNLFPDGEVVARRALRTAIRSIHNYCSPSIR